ncbi:MAG: HPP family protein [Sphingomonadales bacterium]|nr:HPP family protein [Sphingomonadales bacterium]
MSMTDTPAWRRNVGGALGALIGIAVVGAASRALMQAAPALAPPGTAWLIAPLGASAVILFLLPASPLAQPWPAFGSQLIAAAVGLAMARSGCDPALAAGLAVGLTAALMLPTRTLHPPAGGTAVMMALAGPPILRAGWGFLAVPVAVNCALLVLAALAWNRMTGHQYPHHPAPPPPAPGPTLADFQAVLDTWEDNIDVSAEDLLALNRAAQARATG